MKVVLLAGYRFDSNVDDAPGLGRTADGTLQLDHRIAQLEALGLHVICVVSGEAAAHQISRSRRLADVELVYDTHAGDVNLISNIRAGLVALLEHEPCFVMPVELPCPARDTWTKLTHAAYAADAAGAKVSLAQIHRADDPHDFGFPLLVTRFGVKELARLENLVSLADTRLEYLRPSI